MRDKRCRYLRAAQRPVWGHLVKLLITGAGGQLGREFADVLTAGRADIGAIPDAYHDAQVRYVTRQDLDLADEDAAKAFFAEQQFDIIMNCAAMTNVDACESDYEAAYAGNVRAPQLLARAADACGAKLVHFSTDYVFDGQGTRPYTESDTCNPATAYGKSKLEGEQHVLNECSRSFVIRTSWLYGVHGSNFVKTMLRIARETGAIKVVDDQRGNPTNANDLVYEALKLALTDEYGIYHCTGEGVCSWFEFASAIVEFAGIDCARTPCTSAEFARPAPRPANSALANDHLAATIGNEMRPWREALASYLQHCNMM